jgi:hypothetical protein
MHIFFPYHSDSQPLGGWLNAEIYLFAPGSANAHKDDKAEMDL